MPRMPRSSREVIAERTEWLAPLIKELDVYHASFPYAQEAAIALFNARHLTKEFVAEGLSPKWNQGCVSVADVTVPIDLLLKLDDCTELVDTARVMGTNIQAAFGTEKTSKRRFGGQLLEYEIEGSLLEVRMYGTRSELCHFHAAITCLYNFYVNEFMYDEWNFESHWPHLNYNKPKVKADKPIRKIIRG